jgi:hypothetical protein
LSSSVKPAQCSNPATVPLELEWFANEEPRNSKAKLLRLIATMGMLLAEVLFRDD